MIFLMTLDSIVIFYFSFLLLVIFIPDIGQINHITMPSFKEPEKVPLSHVPRSRQSQVSVNINMFITTSKNMEVIKRRNQDSISSAMLAHRALTLSWGKKAVSPARHDPCPSILLKQVPWGAVQWFFGP